MRNIARRRHREEEEESVFVSMTDMTISFLIILMILLAFFASRFTPDDWVPRAELEKLQIQLTEIQERIVSLEAIVTSLYKTIGQLSLRAPITREELAALRRELVLYREKLVDMQGKLVSRESSLQAARLVIGIRDKRIRQLEADLTRLRPLVAELHEWQARIVYLRELVLSLYDVIAQLSLRAPITPEELATLRQELSVARQPKPLEEYLRGIAEARLILIQKLRGAIQQEFPDLQVVISAESDALRFQGEGLFEFDARTLESAKRQIVERISEILDELLPCYTFGPRSAYDPVCNPGHAVIEAVQIEGHTDSRGTVNYNIELASDRAVSTYVAMSDHVSGLRDHTNLDDEPVLSVAGYGESRPVATNDTPQGRSTNRRIDLRFIMYTPIHSREIENIRRSLTRGQRPWMQP